MAYALTAIFTELITNNAAVLMFPIALAVSKQLGVNFLPFAVVLPDVLIDDVESDLSRYNLAAMQAIVEKPPVNEAPSNLSVVGRYVLSSRIWDLLEKTPPGAGNEIQLTDTIGMLMDDEPVEAFHIQGRSHDCGNKQGYMQTFVTYGRRHPALGGAFSEFLAGLG